MFRLYTQQEEVDRVRRLKQNDIASFCRERRDRRRLKKRYVGYSAETRSFLGMMRDDPCVYCGGIADTIDHIVPKYKHGSNTWENLAPACANCNNSKGSKDLLLYLYVRNKRYEYTQI